MALVYIIRHKHSDNCYIGSTKNLNKRKIDHRNNCHYENQRKYYIKLYVFIRENGGWDNFDMAKICDCDENEMLNMEQYHMDFVKPSLNTHRAIGRDEESYRNKRIEKWKKNKDIRCKEKKEKMSCECGSSVRKSDKARHYKCQKHQRFLASSSCSISCAI